MYVRVSDGNKKIQVDYDVMVDGSVNIWRSWLVGYGSDVVMSKELREKAINKIITEGSEDAKK
jgi:hypothetical protein